MGFKVFHVYSVCAFESL